MTRLCLVQEKIVQDPVMIVCFQTSLHGSARASLMSCPFFACFAELSIVKLATEPSRILKNNRHPKVTGRSQISQQFTAYVDDLSQISQHKHPAIDCGQSTCAYLSRTASLDPSIPPESVAAKLHRKRTSFSTR